MRYTALVLAAGRGRDDPMAQAFGVDHKCLLEVGGVPMLVRVLDALSRTPEIERIAVSIEDAAVLHGARGYAEIAARTAVRAVQSGDRASVSVALALDSGAVDYPLLVTTADHALLDADLASTFCRQSAATGADLTVGLARAETVLAAYPGAVRTFLKFADGRFSGCNLFAFSSARARRAIDFWQHVERNRKQPWKLIAAFGPVALVAYALGLVSLDRAFAGGSRKLGLIARPVELTRAEAAIDVDKPSDLKLAEAILAGKT